MSSSFLRISGFKEISSEICAQQESTRKLEPDGVVVVLQQGGPFKEIVVASFNSLLAADLNRHFQSIV